MEKNNIEISDFDKKYLDDILAGAGTWFSAHLLRLIAKADMENLALLRKIYPNHVKVVVKFLRG